MEFAMEVDVGKTEAKMKQTELCEKMAQNSPLTNLFVMAEEIQPQTANKIADWFYGEVIGYDLTVELLYAIIS